jgi:alpha-galactosidase
MTMKPLLITLIPVLVVSLGSATRAESESCTFAARPHAEWSETPPMGWNSYDAYHAAITEDQFKAVVDVLAERMLPHGYEYAVLDYLWYHPGPETWDADHDWHTWWPHARRDPDTGRMIPMLVLDDNGRPMPALNRFPSAADGQGLRALADYVHAKGMKFGLHLMRGIPTEAVEANRPLRGTRYGLQDIADLDDRSSFLSGIFTGLKPDHPGSQAWYDDLFRLYADWGVDYIKADDMLRPPYHAREIEMMRTAIDRSGRPMVLSLSYGETPISQAAHLVENANLWRVSSDFWDRWTDLRRNFDLLYAWSPFADEGTWPDGDMIPIGRLMLSGWEFSGAENLNRTKGRNERDDNFTPDERQTLMSLWAIARSPLMWGGDPVSSPDWAFALLTNDEVIAVNQAGRKPRQILGHSHRDQSLRIWISDAGDGARYVGLFNLREEPARVTFNLEWEDMAGLWQVRNLWTHTEEGLIESRLSRELPPHGSALFRLGPLR